jgi:hypothetical protein
MWRREGISSMLKPVLADPRAGGARRRSVAIVGASLTTSA